ncbi:hypothetical protein EV401DRAFT_1902142 [Pisolithus croceorrhizus]|nr:hypothetical protein EV401DRAFT_1902142 [Pisolithus croceorrhizus]
MPQPPNPVPVPVSCQWDQCSTLFPNREELLHHIREEHIIPMSPMHKDEIFLMKKLVGEKIRAAITIPGDSSSQMDESPTLQWPEDEESGGSRPQEQPGVIVPSQGGLPSPDDRLRERDPTFSTGRFEVPEAVESLSNNLDEPQTLVGCIDHYMPQTQAAYHSQDVDSSQ